MTSGRIGQAPKEIVRVIMIVSGECESAVAEMNFTPETMEKTHDVSRDYCNVTINKESYIKPRHQHICEVL
jgi:hypothetical protein